MKKIEKDYELLRKEVVEKVKQASKLLLEANVLIPKAKIIHPELEDIGKIPQGFTNSHHGFYKSGYNDDDYSEYARDIQDLDQIVAHKDSMYSVLSQIGWRMSSIGC